MPSDYVRTGSLQVTPPLRTPCLHSASPPFPLSAMLLADGLPFVVVLVSLCLFAFAAGAVDAAVGGGGLIQLPALLNLLPETPPATLHGTSKMSSVCGTTFAARSSIRKVRIPWALVLPAAINPFILSFAGAATVTHIPPT